MKSPAHPEAPQAGRACFVSWSGGKDSCLALWRAIRAGHKPRLLFTMFIEGGERSHSHGLRKEIISAQAAALGLSPVFRAATWAEYEAQFADGLREIAQAGVTLGIFGDIDIDAHRQWVERLCAAAGVEACEPLWRADRGSLLSEFIAAGFRATIVAVKDGTLSRNFLGRVLDAPLVAELCAAGIDPSGERGEYHTVVTAGPAFTHALSLRPLGSVLRDGYWFLDLAIDPSSRPPTGAP